MRKFNILKYLTVLPLLGSTALPLALTSCGDPTYTVMFQAGTGGSLTHDPGSISVKKNTTWKAVKEQYNPTAAADNEHVFEDTWYVGDTLLTDNYQFTSAATITARFADAVTLSFENAKGGTISSTTSLKVKANTKWKDITNKPTATADTGYTFKYWNVWGDEITDDTVMSKSVTVTPRFALSGLPEIKTKNIFQSKLYEYNGSEYVAASILTSGISTLQINGSSVGYIPAETYFYIFKDIYSITCTTDYSTHKATIVNGKHTDAPCVIDFINQTITFTDYEAFIDYKSNSYGPLTGGCNGGQNYYNSVVSDPNKYKSGAKVIDLKKYGIPIYDYWQESTSEAFCLLPYEFYKDIFCLGLSFTSPTGSWDFNGSGLYQIIEGYDNDTIVAAKAKAKAAAPDGFYNSDYMEYCYNLLALSLDTRFGLIERTRRNKAETFKYFPNGAYATLKDYHDGLVSTDNNKSSDTLRKLFTEQMDDAGHSNYTHLNVFSTKTVEKSATQGVERASKNSLYTGLSTARSAQSITPGYQEFEHATKGKIAYITFDSFVAASGVTDAEKTECTTRGISSRELPGDPYTTSSNYMNDTLRMTMYANEKIQNDPSIKNVVVDLTCNGGGTVYTEFFIASWLCGGIQQKIYNPTTNGYCEFTVKADINADGQFTSADYLPSTVEHLYVITSSYSFSCGNMLPCTIQDNRSADTTTFIGTKSGGGACYVEANVLLGLNTICRFSSTSHSLRVASSYGNYISNDTGNDITAGWEMDDIAEPEKFYDRAAINNRIWGE